MSDNYYDDELRKALSAELKTGRVVERGVSSAYFDILGKHYPSSGSKIDWAHVSGSIECTEPSVALHEKAFVRFFEHTVDRFALAGVAIYVGDSAISFALSASIQVHREVLPKLLTVPQHHYFFAVDYSWCLSMTLEGDMAFGRSTTCRYAPVWTGSS